jgi:hypothetical protein
MRDQIFRRACIVRNDAGLFFQHVPAFAGRFDSDEDMQGSLLCSGDSQRSFLCFLGVLRKRRRHAF